MRKLRFLFFLFFLGFKVYPQGFTGSRTLHYGLQKGLSFGIVNSICQDKRGFMWIGTADGLNRFDGKTFKVFKNEKDNPRSLSSNFVQAVYADASGTVWVSSRDGLNQYDPKSSDFIHHRFNSGASAAFQNDISSITGSRNGNLWVGTSDGFFYFNVKNRKFRNYSHKNLKGLPGNSSSILSLFEDSKGVLWIGTSDKGVAAYKVVDGNVLSVVKFDNLIKETRINRIYEDKNSDVWIASSNGLAVYRRNINKFEFFNGPAHGLSSNIFLSLAEDHQGELLVGLQEGGLYKVNSKGGTYSFEMVKGESGAPLISRSVQYLFRDKDKNIWLGTYGSGLYMISSLNEKFRKFQIRQEDDSFVRYYGICHDHQGNLWLGTDGNGIYKSTPEGKILNHYTADGSAGSITDNAILSAYKDSRNRLWFGSYQKGLFLYNSSRDNFKSYRRNLGNTKSLGANDVRVIFEDRSRRLWIGTNGGGLNLLNEGAGDFTRFNNANSDISSNDVRSLAEDRKGNLWVGTYGGGLNYFDVRGKKFYRIFRGEREKSIISNNVVFALYLDKRGQLWIGTEGDGLIRYNTFTKAVRVYDEKSGLSNNTVNAIKSEDGEVLWLSTNKGLSRLDTKTGKLINYDSNDGLQQGQFHEGSAIYSPEKQLMVFGGTEGWNVFNPSQVKESLVHPDVLITGLKLFGKEAEGSQREENKDLTETGEIVLTPDQPVFSLSYVMLDYAFPGEGEFAYKMEGLEKEWNYVKDQQSATYRYLSPGTYTFQVKAANHDGVWSENYSSIKVKVLPPWYETWWAYLFYLSSAIGGAYSYIRYRTKQARLKYEIKTAQFEAENEKELHRKKSDFFTSISHEFRTPLTLIINPLKEMLYEEGKEISPAKLNVVYRNARRLLSLVDQLLLYRKSESETGKLKVVKLNISSVCREVVLCFTNQARAQKIDLSFEVGNEEIEIYADREKIEIVLFNLISNALKFTPESGSVQLKLVEKDEAVEIFVRDTGSGIPDHVGLKLFDQFYQVNGGKGPVKSGFGIGLYLAKNFIEGHKGTIDYRSKEGEGTSFFISLLKGKSHFSSNIIFEEVPEVSVFLDELMEDLKPMDSIIDEPGAGEKAADLYTEVKTVLIIDDNSEIRRYVKQLFQQEFEVLEADNGTTGFELVAKYMPDIVITDVMMQGISGIELCRKIKDDPSLSHIPIILLTASSSAEVKLKGIECGAEDFISKPFEKEILMARVSGILKSRNNLQNYFYNQVTLQSDNSKISSEYKEFLDKCIQIVESHLMDQDFGIGKLADKLAMSKSTLYLRIKLVSGQSGNAFIRSIRLRKAAEIFISTNSTVSETAYVVGIRDIKYFREQFNKLFGMNPSEYIRKYRKQFNSTYTIKKEMAGKSGD